MTEYYSVNLSRYVMKLNSPYEEMIKGYLSKDSDIKEKSSKEQKKVVQNYKKVTVQEDEVITDSIVTCLGGGEA